MADGATKGDLENTAPHGARQSGSESAYDHERQAQHGAHPIDLCDSLEGLEASQSARIDALESVAEDQRRAGLEQRRQLRRSQRVGRKPRGKKHQNCASDDAAGGGHEENQTNDPSAAYGVAFAQLGHIFGSGDAQAQSGEGAKQTHRALNDGELTKGRNTKHARDDDGTCHSQTSSQHRSNERPKHTPGQSHRKRRSAKTQPQWMKNLGGRGGDPDANSFGH
ncbi:MAG TPA: hypothetical protein VK731_10875 [Candidatus Cybelea sp.]|nr:hypothetical protein [Candidatus Cybelea sp.]